LSDPWLQTECAKLAGPFRKGSDDGKQTCGGSRTNLGSMEVRPPLEVSSGWDPELGALSPNTTVIYLPGASESRTITGSLPASKSLSALVPPPKLRGKPKSPI